MKLLAADIAFSQAVRAAADWTCQKCGIVKPPVYRRGGSGLELSHRYGRRHRTIRWCVDNGDCLCTGCHRYFEENPVDYTSWMIERDGQGVLDILREKRDNRVKIPKSEERAIAAHYRGELEKVEKKRLDGVTGPIVIVSYQ